MSWQGWKTMACVLAIVMVVSVPSTHAGPYEDALAAQERGDVAKKERNRLKSAADVEQQEQNIIAAMNGLEGKCGTRSNIAKASGAGAGGGKAFNLAFNNLVDSGKLEKAKVRPRNGQTYDGFRLTEG